MTELTFHRSDARVMFICAPFTLSRLDNEFACQLFIEMNVDKHSTLGDDLMRVHLTGKELSTSDLLVQGKGKRARKTRSLYHVEFFLSFVLSLGEEHVARRCCWNQKCRELTIVSLSLVVAAAFAAAQRAQTNHTFWRIKKSRASSRLDF